MPSSALNLLLVGLVAAQRFLQRLDIADDAPNAPHVDLGERFEAVTPAAGKGGGGSGEAHWHGHSAVGCNLAASDGTVIPCDGCGNKKSRAPDEQCPVTNLQRDNRMEISQED